MKKVPFQVRKGQATVQVISEVVNLHFPNGQTDLDVFGRKKDFDPDMPPTFSLPDLRKITIVYGESEPRKFELRQP